MALPAYSLLNGIGLMVGMGGATRYSILRGEGPGGRGQPGVHSRCGNGGAFRNPFHCGGASVLLEIAGGPGSLGQVQELASIYLRTLLTFSPCCFI